MKKQAEEEKKRIVGSLTSEINTYQQQALEINQMIIEQGNVLKQKLSCGDVDTGWITYYQRYVTDMRREISRKIQKVAEIQKKLQRARIELANAAKETKMLEKLKEKQYNEFMANIELKEKKELDEIGGQLYIRQMLSK